MKQILSIQSSVTLGFVGNRVAAPVLTAMGHHPLAVDTIALAAHPGYGSRSGGVPANDDFTEILGALSLFDALGGIDFVITGYLGTAHQASPIKETLNSWRRQLEEHTNQQQERLQQQQQQQGQQQQQQQQQRQWVQHQQLQQLQSQQLQHHSL